jgi:hypothetical protein
MLLASLAFAMAAATAPLSPQAQAAIQPVIDAIAAERAAQARLPPPEDDAEKLRRLGRLDQAPRRALKDVDFTKAPEAERKAARAAMGAAIDQVDDAAEAEVLRLVPAEGWFARSKYGEEAARAAFLIIQHSTIENWRRFLPVIERFVARGEADGNSYALLYDRLATSEGRPQRYGSQSRCVDGEMQPYPLEDSARVDEFRRQMRLDPVSFAEYAAASKRFSYLCPR